MNPPLDRQAPQDMQAAPAHGNTVHATGLPRHGDPCIQRSRSNRCPGTEDQRSLAPPRAVAGALWRRYLKRQHGMPVPRILPAMAGLHRVNRIDRTGLAYAHAHGADSPRHCGPVHPTGPKQSLISSGDQGLLAPEISATRGHRPLMRKKDQRSPRPAPSVAPPWHATGAWHPRFPDASPATMPCRKHGPHP